MSSQAIQIGRRIRLGRPLSPPVEAGLGRGQKRRVAAWFMVVPILRTTAGKTSAKVGPAARRFESVVDAMPGRKLCALLATASSRFHRNHLPRVRLGPAVRGRRQSRARGQPEPGVHPVALGLDHNVRRLGPFGHKGMDRHHRVANVLFNHRLDLNRPRRTWSVGSPHREVRAVGPMMSVHLAGVQTGGGPNSGESLRGRSRQCAVWELGVGPLGAVQTVGRLKSGAGTGAVRRGWSGLGGPAGWSGRVAPG